MAPARLPLRGCRIGAGRPATRTGSRAMRVSYAIVFVSDMPRSVAFYRDVVGLPLRFESPGWSEFATEGATLALHRGEPRAPEASPTGDLAAGHSRPGLRVPDLDAFHQRMLAYQVPCQQPPTPTFGTRIALYLDPDGLALSVGEEPRAGAGGPRQ